MQVKPAPRASIRADRDEIQHRWNLRKLQREIDNFPWLESLNGSIRSILNLAPTWVTHTEVADMLPEESVRPLLAQCLRIIELKEMPYSEYLKTEEWRARSLRCREQSGGKCALNQKHPAEHAHHRTYERRGLELADDLIALCSDCHKKHHGWDR